MWAAGVGRSAAISMRKRAWVASPEGVLPTAWVHCVRWAALTLLPIACAAGICSGSRFSQACKSWVNTSPWACAAKRRNASCALSMANLWARKAASPKRGPRGAESSRSRQPPGLSPNLPPALPPIAPLAPGLPSRPRPLCDGNSVRFWPGRSSPRTATTGRGTALGVGVGATDSTGSATTSVAVATMGSSGAGKGADAAAATGLGTSTGDSPRLTRSKFCMAARIAEASPLATADSTALDASITALSTGVRAACACSRTVDLRAKASSMGFLKASQSFCSRRRSKTTAWASSCQRCCKALTASIRNVGAVPKACASAIKALRRSKLAFCTISKGSCAAWMAAFH